MDTTKLLALQALGQVVDPELGLDIVTLGLIYDLEIKEDSVRVSMSLTSPGCPIGPTIISMVQEALESLPGDRKVSVELVWEPPWGSAMISEEGKMTIGF